MVMVTTITMTISYIAFAGLDEGRAGTDIDHKRMFGINVLAMLLLPKQQNGKHSLMPCSNQGCGLEELTYLLHATLAPRLSRNCIKRYQRKNKQEGNNFDTRKGRKEGRQAGRKEGRQAGRKEGMTAGRKRQRPRA